MAEHRRRDKPLTEEEKQRILRTIKSNRDLTVDMVYELGLEYDQKNLLPEHNPEERKRMGLDDEKPDEEDSKP